MSWLLPVELLPFAAALALVLSWPRGRLPTSTVRLVLAVLAITIGTVAVFMAAWALDWWIEQRW